MGKADPDKMSFLEHLDELRSRLIKVVLWLIGTAVCWSFRDPIFHFLTQPLRVHHPDIKFIFTSPSEALMLKMKMSFFVGIFLAAPFILYQVWAFVAPGLYRHEKVYAVPFIGRASSSWRRLRPLLPLPHHLPLPGGLRRADMQFLPKVGEYYSFYSWFLLGLGVVFQLPVVIFVLARIGLVTPGFLMRKFKYAVVIAFVVAAVITPTPDVVAQSCWRCPCWASTCAWKCSSAGRDGGRSRSARKREVEGRAQHDLLLPGLLRVHLHDVGRALHRLVHRAGSALHGGTFSATCTTLRCSSSQTMSINLQFFIQIPWKSTVSKMNSIAWSRASEGRNMSPIWRSGSLIITSV